MERTTILGVDAAVAKTFGERAKGLIGVESLPEGTGLLITRCNAIHTMFMKMTIDAVFLDRNGRVVKTVRGIRPWRLFVWGGFRASMVLETQSRA